MTVPQHAPAKVLKEQEFIIPVTDNRGRSDIIQFRAMPVFMRQAEEIITQRNFPFKTVTDLFRWCIFKGLQELDGIAPTKGFMSYLMMQVRVMRDEIYKMEMVSESDLMEKVVRDHLKDGSNSGKLQALALVTRALEDANKIKERPWRQKMLKEIRAKFGYVLKMSGEVMEQVSIHPEDQEEVEDGD